MTVPDQVEQQAFVRLPWESGRMSRIGAAWRTLWLGMFRPGKYLQVRRTDDVASFFAIAYTLFCLVPLLLLSLGMYLATEEWPHAVRPNREIPVAVGCCCVVPAPGSLTPGMVCVSLLSSLPLFPLQILLQGRCIGWGLSI